MKKGLMVVIAVCCLVLMLGGSSMAAPIKGSVYYNVTGYNETTHTLNSTLGHAPGSGGILGGTFTVDAINFDSEALSGSYGGPVTYSQFLSNSLGTNPSPGPNGLVWSTPEQKAWGDSTTLLTSSMYTSFFQLSGVAYFSENFSIRHDDGFFLYIGDSYSDLYDYSHPTAPEMANMTLSSRGLTPGSYKFIINYAAWNGFPEVLQITSGVSVPEPTTMLLLGLGLIGLAGVRRKFKK
jgi:hypothetical protein